MSDTSFGLPPGATESEEVIYITGPVGPPGPGDMNKVDNLSGLTDYAVARTNLGLGTLATQSGTFSAKEDVANKSTSVTTDQASNAKYPSVKSVYDWAVGAFAKYSGDADFYQYSIVRTVSGGNLTVALKNYEGNDPTTLKPVKIMIGGVVRTITGALNVSGANAGDSGTNYLNLGSAELATKEADLFVYLGWATAGSTVNMFLSRIPTAVLYEDFTPLNSAEKGRMRSLNVSPTNGDPVVNIGRFNAILSGGAGYTWSTGTSIIINRPIYTTRQLNYTPVYTGFSSPPTTSEAIYTISNDTLLIKFRHGANGTSNATTFTQTLPFGVAQGEHNIVGAIIDNGTAPGALGLGLLSGSAIAFYKDGNLTAWTASGGKRMYNGMQTTYNI